MGAKCLKEVGASGCPRSEMERCGAWQGGVPARACMWLHAKPINTNPQKTAAGLLHGTLRQTAHAARRRSSLQPLLPFGWQRPQVAAQ